MRFCGNCGTRLVEATTIRTVSMEELLAESPNPDPTPPAHIGAAGPDLLERFRSAGLEASGQRRSVTVLFADLTGYTVISGQMDNEDLFDLIQRYIRVLVNEVYKYEGIVDKLTGDGLMALYGAPIAHENNAERAVRSALDMQAAVNALSQETRQQLGVELRMRIGLHSGEVIVGGVGSNLLMDYTAIGDTVNLARRMEEAAQPGSILVSEAVQRQTRALINFEAQPAQALKGYGQPIAAFCVRGLKSQPGSRRGIEGLRAPMIGRDAELNTLQKAITALHDHKSGSLVLLTGEAGIGKSRLTTEFKALAVSRGVRFLEGSSLTYRRSLAYWVFLDLLRNFLDVTQDTPDEIVITRLAQAAQEALGDRAGEILPYLEYLFSLKSSNPASSEHLRYLDASQLRQHIFLAVRDLLAAAASRQPLLLILEDLHWADDASLDLLLFLVEAVPQAPLMVYAIARSIRGSPLSKLDEWASRQIPDRYYPLRLESLTPGETSHLLFKLLTVSHLPENLQRQILEKSAGVPFYLEEILRMLIDKGILLRHEEGWQVSMGAESASLGVPDTLQGLILARFDRLEPLQRRVLQVASVIGHQFNRRLLGAMLQTENESQIDDALQALVGREYITLLSESPDAEYAFSHVLMSEAIYATLLKRERILLHGEVGNTIETLFADRLEEHVELLARHYSWSSQQDRALHYLILAGQKAAANNINEQARQNFVQALSLLPQVRHTAEQALRVHTGLGDVRVLGGEYASAQQNYQSALQVISTEDPSLFAEERSSLERKIARTLERQGEYDQALRHLKRAQAALEFTATPQPVERAQVLSDTAWIHFRQGNFTESEYLLNQAISLVEGTTAYDAISSIYNRLGGIAYNQGNWNRTADYLRKSIAIREAIGDLVGLATSLNNLGLLGIEMGDFKEALENLTRSYELKSRLGQPEGISMTLNNLGWLRFQLGELDAAKEDLEKALELARQIGFTSLEGQVLKNFGEMYLAARDWEQARLVLRETAKRVEELGAYNQLLDTLRLLGEAALGANDLVEAQACASRIQSLTLGLGEQTTQLSSVQRGEFWRFRGMLALHAGDYETSQNYLRESERIFQALGSRLYQGRAAMQLGALAEAQGDRRAAQLRYREAALLFRSSGAKLEEHHAQEAAHRVTT